MNDSQQKAVTPLTPAEAAAAIQSAEHESKFHEDAVAVDVAINEIVLDGQPDETISAHSARVEEDTTHGFKHDVAHVLNEGLDLLEPDHGAKAVEADRVRGLDVVKTEDASGLIPE